MDNRKMKDRELIIDQHANGKICIDCKTRQAIGYYLLIGNRRRYVSGPCRERRRMVVESIREAEG